MPITRRGRSCPAKPGDHAGVRRAGDGADDDRVEEDAELALLLLHLVAPSSRSPGRRAGGPTRPAGIAYGLPPAASTSRDRPLPALLEADAEAGLDEPHVGAHDPAQQDVADAVVDHVRPVDPALLHEHAARGPGARGDRRDLARVVGLDAADRDQRVAALGERVGDEVLELAGLVAAEGEPELQSSRLAQIDAPPRCFVSRSSRWTGEGPNVSGWRGKSSRLGMVATR